MRSFVKGIGVALCAVFLAGSAAAQSTEGMFASGAVNAVIDGLHAAAAAADEPRYFSYFSADAIFLGTDSTERWTREQFRTWAHPYFASGKGWKYETTSRWISFGPDRRVAWFDELLQNATLGTCRGSGVLLQQADGSWKIAQYNLSIPIPNDLADEVAKRIAVETQKTKKKGA